MKQAINQINFGTDIKIQPLSIVDTLCDEVMPKQKSSIFSKVVDLLFKQPDLTLEQWQRIESKPRIRSYDISNYDGGHR